MNRKIIFFLLILGFIPANRSNALNLTKYSTALKAEKNIKSVSSLTKKLILLKNISIADMKFSTKAENVGMLLNKAIKEKRIISGEDFYFYKQFNKFDNGDVLLLKCLKSNICDLDEYLNVINKSQLHMEVVQKYPHLNLAQVNHKVGQVNENIMSRYFENSGWTKIEGEIGRNGIDGLFIQKTRAGAVKNVLLVESKYNKSNLIDTKSGKQMSKQWALKKIDNLKIKYPNDGTYKQIEAFINNDLHKGRIWSLTTTKSEIKISLRKIESLNDSVAVSPLNSGEKMLINYKENGLISLENPKNSFQEKIVNWYKEELENI
jgi:hypothetical protein